MGKGAALRWIENQLLRPHLRGRGIELGALWRKTPLAREGRAWHVDRSGAAALRAHYSEVSKPLVLPDVVADAAQLPFRSRSLHFIIASHVLEHLPFPLAALRHWHELLRPGGALLLRVPDKRWTFDKRRKRTTLEHLIAEDSDSKSFDRRSHYADWVQGVTALRPETAEFNAEIERLMAADYSIHYHVWTTDDIREILEHLRSEHSAQLESVFFLPGRIYRKEVVFLGKRLGNQTLKKAVQ